MNIAVCVKEVPATDSKIRLRDDAPAIVTDGIKFVVNPYDEIAVEAALQLKEEHGGEVTVVSLGPPGILETLRSCLAVGCDKTIHLNDPAFEGGDSFATAKALAKVLSDLSPDLILAGKQSVDSDCGAVFILLAEFLGLPHVGVVTKIEVSPDGKSVVCHREVEGAHEIIEAPLPVVIGAQKGLNEPRYPSLKGIMMAKKKPIEEKDAGSLGFSPDEVGKAGSRVITESMSLPPERPAGRIVEGEPADAAREVMRLLRDEAKVI